MSACEAGSAIFPGQLNAGIRRLRSLRLQRRRAPAHAALAVIILLVSLALISPASAEQPRPPEILTIDQAVALAVRNNRPLKNAALEVEKSNQDVAAFKTKRLPATSLNIFAGELLTQANFHFSQGVFGNFPGIGPVPATDTNIASGHRPFAFVVGQAVQPLSQQYKINLGLRLKELTSEIERQKLRVKQQAVVNQVRRLYYDLAQKQAALQASDENLRYLHELRRVVAQYVAAKTALKGDDLEVEARVAQEQYQDIKLRDALQEGKEQMNLLLDRDLGSDFAIDEVPSAIPVEEDLAAAQALALRQRPELQLAQAVSRQTDYDRRLSKADYIPNVNLMLHYLSPFGSEVLPHNIVSLGLQVQWEPLDWGRRKHQVEEKKLTEEQSEQAASEIQAKVLLDVNRRFRELAEARALLAAVSAAREAARERLRVVTNQYAERSLLLKDVLEAQTTLSETTSKYEQSLASFWTAKADFEKALGEE